MSKQNTTIPRIEAKFSKSRRFTYYDVMETIYCCYQSAYVNLTKLHKMGTIHIVDWMHRSKTSRLTPVFAWGQWHDVPKPPPASKTNYQKRYRAIIRQGMPQRHTFIAQLRGIAQ